MSRIPTLQAQDRLLLQVLRHRIRFHAPIALRHLPESTDWATMGATEDRNILANRGNGLARPTIATRSSRGPTLGSSITDAGIQNFSRAAYNLVARPANVGRFECCPIPRWEHLPMTPSPKSCLHHVVSPDRLSVRIAYRSHSFIHPSVSSLCCWSCSRHIFPVFLILAVYVFHWGPPVETQACLRQNVPQK